MLKILLVNTSSNLVVLFVKLAITFIMTPVLVRNLGNYDYGIWEMLVAVLGYMGLLDLGIKPAIGRFSAKLNAEGDRKGLLEVYSTTMVYMTLIGILLLIFFTLWAYWFPSSIAPEGTPTQRYTLLLLIIGVQLLFVFPGYVAESYMEGLQLYYLKNSITLVNSVIGASIIYTLITPENGLLLLAGANAIGMLVKYLLLIAILARPSYGAISPHIRQFSWPRLKELVIFSSKSFVQGVATRLEYATDSLVIGSILGPAAVPFYSIPANLVRYIRAIGFNLTHAFMPLFSDLNARQEQAKIQKVYYAASKLVVGIITPLAAGVAVVGGPFLGLWIGEDFRVNADWIVLLLVIFTTVPFLNPFFSRYLTAIGKHGILARLAPVSAVMNLVISIILVKKIGIIGAALGSVIPVFIFVPVYLSYTCRYLGITVRSYVVKCIMPSLIPTIVMAAVVLLMRLETGFKNYADLLLAVLVGAVLYCVLFWLFSITRHEKAMVMQRLFYKQGRQ